MGSGVGWLWHLLLAVVYYLVPYYTITLYLHSQCPPVSPPNLADVTNEIMPNRQ
jgi:hypothetical protein